ncbi:HAD family phosphatase [Elizabethkingia sp. JS20170427COW]|uniref:HAD family hydrolase n=1 Tax=Elizabethkingia sp. JS20170427COW TaxID=2583851 RepID=UPI0011105DA4|nr:HAD family phosphatase [Elizabethkingia sp. JS20170427COW]QCX53712.1 HAD family phosphatase [Elizabethkingia sp. JS20170427COW]
MNIKNIVFDFGGVLMDWNPRYLYKEIFSNEDEMEYFLNNIATLSWNMEQDRGRSLQEATEILQKQYPKYSKEIALYYGEWPKMLKGAFEKNVELLYRLHEKFPTYGLTNWSAETFPYAYEHYPFFKLFKGIVVSGEEKLIKPDEAIYKVFLSRYELNANECLFIDDNLHNIEAAQKLGFATTHLPEGEDLEIHLKNLELL